MITIQASSIDELNIIWRRLRKDFQVIESIHLDPKSLQYRMVVNRPELTKMLKGVGDKVLERLEMYQDDALIGTRTLNQLNERIELEANDFPSLEPLVKIWTLISASDKKAVFAYLRNELGLDESDAEDKAVEALGMDA